MSSCQHWGFYDEDEIVSRPSNTFVQVMAWCLTTPSHYLKQCSPYIWKDGLYIETGLENSLGFYGLWMLLFDVCLGGFRILHILVHKNDRMQIYWDRELSTWWLQKRKELVYWLLKCRQICWNIVVHIELRWLHSPQKECGFIDKILKKWIKYFGVKRMWWKLSLLPVINFAKHSSSRHLEGNTDHVCRWCTTHTYTDIMSIIHSVLWLLICMRYWDI